MSDALRPGNPAEGEYTDSELPLSAELPKEEYEEVEEIIGTGDVLDDGIDDDLDEDLSDEVDVEVVEIIDDDTYPGRDSGL